MTLGESRFGLTDTFEFENTVRDQADGSKVVVIDAEDIEGVASVSGVGLRFGDGLTGSRPSQAGEWTDFNIHDPGVHGTVNTGPRILILDEPSTSATLFFPGAGQNQGDDQRPDFGAGLQNPIPEPNDAARISVIDHARLVDYRIDPGSAADHSAFDPGFWDLF